MCICVYTHTIYIYIYTYIHTYINTYIHTYIHTYMYMYQLAQLLSVCVTVAVADCYVCFVHDGGQNLGARFMIHTGMLLYLHQLYVHNN